MLYWFHYFKIPFYADFVEIESSEIGSKVCLSDCVLDLLNL